MESNNQQQAISIPVAILIAGVIIAGAIVYAFGYMPGLKGKTAVTSPKQEEVIPVPKVTATDHRIGSADAKLVFVEYSDMECPFCGTFHPVLKQALAEYGDKVAWVYRHFPLAQIHPHAVEAAVASECVADLKGNDAFWTFINGIFAKQKTIGTELYHAEAKAVGIAAADLDACIKSEKGLEKIQQQFNDAVSAGGQGTPFTAVLNAKGEQVAVFPGSLTYAQLKAQTDALLAKVK